jgi:hypothetical protein
MQNGDCNYLILEMTWGVHGFGCGLQSRNQTQLHSHFDRCKP